MSHYSEQMKGQSVHYSADEATKTACGWNWFRLIITTDWLKVNCRKCLRKKPVEVEVERND